MLNTSVRQIAFFEYERKIHNQRQAGELSVNEINQIWMETQGEALGESVNLDPVLMPYWSYISHFIHAPFYVYAYAFGDCLVNSLYSVYEQGHPDFAKKYLDLLSAGGSKRHHELLAPFNLDARDPEFWQKGLNVIINLIDEFETLVEK
jgi:oligoendopeptidase F